MNLLRRLGIPALIVAAGVAFSGCSTHEIYDSRVPKAKVMQGAAALEDSVDVEIKETEHFFAGRNDTKVTITEGDTKLEIFDHRTSEEIGDVMYDWVKRTTPAGTEIFKKGSYTDPEGRKYDYLTVEFGHGTSNSIPYRAKSLMQGEFNSIYKAAISHATKDILDRMGDH